MSVVMPVRNAGHYLDAAIASILGQTHRDLELAICDDGSTDGSGERIDRWAVRDSRVRGYHRSTGLGPAGSSNWAVDMARAPIVARMDADDIADPERIALQLAALEAHPEAVLIGTLWEGIDASDRVRLPSNPAALNGARGASPFPHGSILFRRDAFVRAGGYRGAADHWEDQEFYWRMAREGAILVLPRPLYRYRFASTSNRLAADQIRVEQAVDRYMRCSRAQAESGDYAQELAAPAPARVPLRVFAALATNRIWSGQRPHLWRRIWRRGRPGTALPALAMLVYLLWADIHPQSLRAALAARLRWKNRGETPGDAPVRWRPGAAPDASAREEPRDPAQGDQDLAA